MGAEVSFHPDFDPPTAAGWVPVTVTVTVTDDPLPYAAELHALGTFESGFEYGASPEEATFSAKSGDNAVAIWCAAALAGVVGGTLDDPQYDLSATGGGASILAELAESSDFVATLSAPEPTTKKKKKKAAAGTTPKVAKSTVVADLSKPVRTYAASGKFEVAERVEHPSFGQGVVEVSEPGKVTVTFATGRRVLVQAKDGGESFGAKGDGLTRPKPFDHANPSAGGKPVPQS